MSDLRKCLAQCAAVFALSVTLTVHGVGQDAPPESPNALCIQPAGDPKEATWITIPGYYYLGSPTFSPDGQWVAFDAYKSNAPRVVSEVWIVKSDGSDPRKVAIGATPRWSPDGERLLFMREQRNAVEQQQHGVFVVERDGTDEQFICEGRWPDWSPDGSQIVFSRGEPDTRGGTQEFSRVYIAKADGTGPELLANGDCPAWSPDGQLVACSYRDPAIGPPMVRIVDLKSGMQRFIGYGWFRPNWTPDSRSVTANGVLAERKTGAIRLAATGGNNPPAPVTEVAGATSPCFSADGRLLVFAAPHAAE